MKEKNIKLSTTVFTITMKKAWERQNLTSISLNGSLKHLQQQEITTQW